MCNSSVVSIFVLTSKSSQETYPPARTGLVIVQGLILLRTRYSSPSSVIPFSLQFYQTVGPRASGEDAGFEEKGAVHNAGEVLGQLTAHHVVFC